MSFVSPRSLKLLEDIVNARDNIADYVDLRTDPMSRDNNSCMDPMSRRAHRSSRTKTMDNGTVEDFDDTLNFFEALQKENEPVTNGNHATNGGTENGVTEDSLGGIPEESEEETSYAISESTLDTTTYDNDTSGAASVQNAGKSRLRKVTNNRRNFNQKHKPTKTVSVHEGSTDQDSISDQAETMSDSGRMGRRQRKLHKRAQMREFRPIGLEPLESAEEKLERKYEELDRLLAGQFLEKKSALSENHLHQMELLRQQYALASHGLPPSGMPAQSRQGAANKENHHYPANEDEAYGTIRTLQATKVGQRRSRSRGTRRRPLSASRRNHSRSTSCEEIDRPSEQNTKNTSKQDYDKKESKSRSRSNSRSRSSSGSPKRLLIPTDTRLKNTENEFVQVWIKRKDIECRKRKAAERKKRKFERKEKIEKQIAKEEKYKDSKNIVQEWMRQKKKEAFQSQRHERQFKNEEAAKAAQERAKRVSGVHGLGVDRPQSAPIRIEMKQKVSRPGTTVAEIQAKLEVRMRGTQVAEESENHLNWSEQEIPQPPVTKYVYRRPVLGKVRLRMKQPDGPERSTSPSGRKPPVEKPLSREEQDRKQRVSYDEWLHQKRKEDVEKKRELKEQAKSHSELESQSPSLVQNGQVNILQGVGLTTTPSSSGSQYKSKIIGPEEQDSIRRTARRKKHVRSVEEEVDTRYDERSESPEEAIHRVAKGVVRYVLRSLSDNDEASEEEVFEDDDETEHDEGLVNLSVNGSKTNLRNRPMSASVITVPSPQTSKSPRRPASAQPKTKPTPRESEQGKLPFPDDIGVPAHIQQVQKKLFPDRMWMNPEDSGERPEPQGSDSTEGKGSSEVSHPEAFPGRDDFHLDQEDPKSGNDSMSSLRKHVSFSEQTTIFDDGSEVEEDIEDWEDGNRNEDYEDLAKARNVFLETDVVPDTRVPSDNFFITKSAEGD